MPVVAAGPAIEASADTLATTQALVGVSGLAETGQVATGATLGLTGSLLSNIAAVQNALITLGTAGPLYGITPYAAAYNTQFANLAASTLGTLGAVGAAQAYLGLGTAALLANSGRRFLINTIYGI